MLQNKFEKMTTSLCTLGAIPCTGNRPIPRHINAEKYGRDVLELIQIDGSRIFLRSKVSIPTLGSTHTPSQRVQWTLFPG